MYVLIICVFRKWNSSGSNLVENSYITISYVHESLLYNKMYGMISQSSVVMLQGVCGCDRFTSSSISDVLKTIVKKDGYRGLLRGWLPRMLFHAPAAAICWSTYEGVKSFFQDFNGDPNTA